MVREKLLSSEGHMLKELLHQLGVRIVVSQDEVKVKTALAISEGCLAVNSAGGGT